MTELAIIAAFLTQIATLATAALAFRASLKNKQAIQEVHVSLNSRLTDLLAVTKSDAHQAGVTEGRKEQ